MEKITADQLKKIPLSDIAKIFTELENKIGSLRLVVSDKESDLYQARLELTELCEYRDQLIKDITVYSTEGNYDHG